MKIAKSSFCSDGIELIILGLSGCLACDKLKTLLDQLYDQPEFKKITIKYLYVKSAKDLANLNLKIKLFPTLLAYKNSKLCLGWEGFAAFAPDEIKCEMVEDVLRQVAALADEDIGEAKL